MILCCPRCNAGHNVPVSAIPSGGLDLSCKRCTETFHVEAPRVVEEGEATQEGGAPVPKEDVSDELISSATIPERTKVGVANPLHELVRMESLPLLTPAGEEVTPSSPFRSESTTSGGALRNVDVMREDFEAALARAHVLTEPPAPSKEGDRATEGVILPVSTLEPRASDGGGAPRDLYERIAQGIRGPEVGGGADGEELSRLKSWNEPSADLDVPSLGTRIFAPLRRVAVALNGAPLALRVALVVFPLSLGTLLVVTSSHPTWVAQPAVQIPVVRSSARAGSDLRSPRASPAVASSPSRGEDEEGPRAAESAVGDPAGARLPRRDDPGPPLEQATSPPATSRHAAPPDELAGEGHAFVQVERARLRPNARDDAEALLKLELGERVREFGRVGEWSLVMILPDGPAGFVSTKLLGPRKPIALLAREVAFEGCAPRRSRDDCLYEGKEQHDACLQRCGVAAGTGAPFGEPARAPAAETDPAVRCAEACRVAFSECQRRCNEPGGGDSSAKRSLRTRRR